jgi:flagellar hook-length control protein FliK
MAGHGGVAPFAEQAPGDFEQHLLGDVTSQPPVLRAKSDKPQHANASPTLTQEPGVEPQDVTPVSVEKDDVTAAHGTDEAYGDRDDTIQDAENLTMVALPAQQVAPAPAAAFDITKAPFTSIDALGIETPQAPPSSGASSANEQSLNAPGVALHATPPKIPEFPALEPVLAPDERSESRSTPRKVVANQRGGRSRQADAMAGSQSHDVQRAGKRHDASLNLDSNDEPDETMLLSPLQELRSEHNTQVKQTFEVSVSSERLTERSAISAASEGHSTTSDAPASEPSASAVSGEASRGQTRTIPPVSSAGTRLNTTERVRFVQRVARAVEAARPDGEIRLRLRPPELGALLLRVKTEDGALAAHIETESANASALLNEHLPELRERLAAMEIRVERFDVEWRGGTSDQSSSKQGGDGSHPDWPGSRGSVPNKSKDVDQSAPGHSRPLQTHRGDLDVVV